MLGVALSDRWFIIKNGQTVGPLTAEDIRASLRDGSFDPFDLVMRDGSSVRRELVEVDELFQSSPVVYDASASGQASITGRQSSGGAAGKVTELVAGQGRLMLADKREEANVTLPANAGSPKPKAADGQQAAPRKKRRDPKHFHLMDGRGRVMGPMSASEIQGLYYKGVLDKTVKVMRDGSGAHVPIARFVSVYSESQSGGRGPQQGAHPMIQGGLATSAQQRMAMAKRQKANPAPRFSPISLLAIGLGVILVIMAVWVIVSSEKSDMAARPTTPAKVHVRPLPDSKAKALKAKKKNAIDERENKRRKSLQLKQQMDHQAALRAARDAKAQRDQKALVAAKARRDAQALREQRLSKQQKLQRVRAERFEAKRRQNAEKARALAALHARQRAQLAKRVPTKNMTRVSVPPPPRPVSPPAATGVAALQDGKKVASLGPMTFDKKAVQNCEGTCAVTFSGAGGSVRVKFFKQVWGPVLLSKSGGVYVTGLVRKSGGSTQIMLSDVK